MLLLCVLRMQAQEQRPVVTLLTDSGTIKIALYNETPLHRDNFLKLVREGFYDGVLFHRVIFGFMIQTGDSLSRHAEPGKLYGDGFYEKYKIPAEIRSCSIAVGRWPQRVRVMRRIRRWNHPCASSISSMAAVSMMTCWMNSRRSLMNTRRAESRCHRKPVRFIRNTVVPLISTDSTPSSERL